MFDSEFLPSRMVKIISANRSAGMVGFMRSLLHTRKQILAARWAPFSMDRQWLSDTWSAGARPYCTSQKPRLSPGPGSTKWGLSGRARTKEEKKHRLTYDRVLARLPWRHAGGNRVHRNCEYVESVQSTAQEFLLSWFQLSGRVAENYPERQRVEESGKSLPVQL